MKIIIFIAINLVLLVSGILIGILVAHSPFGFPGTFDPPAHQEQYVLKVNAGELDATTEWLKDVNVYLVPFYGIRGNRNYSALIFVPHEGKAISIGRELSVYLEAKNTDEVQPIIIQPDDFAPGAVPLVVKLIDEGPNAGQYYNNAQGLTLSYQPHLK